MQSKIKFDRTCIILVCCFLIEPDSAVREVCEGSPRSPWRPSRCRRLVDSDERQTEHL